MAAGRSRARCVIAETLQGLGEVPAIAGRPPTCVVRQLNDMKTGARSGISTALMRAVVEKLSVEDMVAIAAYVGARDPSPYGRSASLERRPAGIREETMFVKACAGLLAACTLLFAAVAACAQDFH